MPVALCILMVTTTSTIILGEEMLPVSASKEDSRNSIAISNTFQKNTTSLETELEQKDEERSLRLDEESAVYITKSKYITSTKISNTNVCMKILTEARCVVDKDSGKVLFVQDFGKPYIHIDSPTYLKFEHGGFNIDRLGDTSARISTTGQFFFNRGGVSVGLDIISLPRHGLIKSEVETLSVKLDW